MAHEDEWIRNKIRAIKGFGPEDVALQVAEVLEELLKKINQLEQDVKELRNGKKR
jgi:hypothetical protein